MIESADIRLKRLKFRAWHRGMKEMDLVLGRFFDAHGATLSPQQLDDFEALLDEADADMYAWMCGRQEQPAAFNTAVWQQIVQFWDSNPNVS